ncbi:MAG: GTP-binding protein [Candidatus Dormiibacterota bacterium]
MLGKAIAPPALPHASGVALLRLAAVGAVDDGKSTLIGRLLHDADQLTEDQLKAMESASQARGHTGLNLSFATDGLRAERERGITIDVAYRYATTPRRKLVIADCPGHVEYTRNMATGASTADLALVVVDVTRGLREQTRRHSALAMLFGVRHLLVAVNKMDLVDWDQRRYHELTSEIRQLARRLGGAEVEVVPISALHGDNVVERSLRARWYRGRTVLEALELVPTSTFAAHGATGFRLPVQLVLRGAEGTSRIAGMLTGRGVSVGDEVVILPQGRRTRVAGLETLGGSVSSAPAPLSVSVTLEDGEGVERGDLIAAPDNPPNVSRNQRATVCWFADRPLRKGQTFVVKHTTRLTEARVVEVESKLDLATLRLVPTQELAANDIGVVRWRLAEPVAADQYRDSRVTGSFIVIDPDSCATVAAAMIGVPTLAIG